MNEIEAIRQLQIGYLGDNESLVQAKHIAIKALEKQVPKKARTFTNDWRKVYTCRCCNNELPYHSNYCPNCGQAIRLE